MTAMKVQYLFIISDINECNGPLNNCAFRCVNIPGSFACICPMGYSLASDGIHCQGNGSILYRHKFMSTNQILEYDHGIFPFQERFLNGLPLLSSNQMF